MTLELINAIVASTGIVIMSEALILIAGMNILKIGDWAWINWKNNLFLFSDVVGGISLIFFALINKNDTNAFILILLLIAHFITHIYRTFEYFKRNEKRFCNNMALAVFNFVKTIGITLVLFLLLF